jgi:monoamine oxidase
MHLFILLILFTFITKTKATFIDNTIHHLRNHQQLTNNNNNNNEDKPTYDCIIIGAGSAGISAGRTLTSYGKKILILEAMERIGGRVHTIYENFPTPVDEGAQFIADVINGNNPFYLMAKQFNYSMIRQDSVPIGFVGGSEIIFFETYGIILATLFSKGELIANGVIKDMTLKQATEGLHALPYFGHALEMVVVSDSTDYEHGSVLDYYTFASHSLPFIYPPGDTLFLPSGLGHLITQLAGGLPIQLKSPVIGISFDTSKNGLVQVTTLNKQTYKSRTVMVTASIGALQSQYITFSPPLPSSHQHAINNIGMSSAAKIVFTFTKNIFTNRCGIKGNEMKSIIVLNQRPVVSMFAQYLGFKMLVFIIDGPEALNFDQLNDTVAIHQYLHITETYFPGAIQSWTGKYARTSWSTNPFIRGATSWAKAGNYNAREILTRNIEKKIWFAGEAVALSDHSLSNGAWVSGMTGAYGILKILGELDGIEEHQKYHGQQQQQHQQQDNFDLLVKE